MAHPFPSHRDTRLQSIGAILSGGAFCTQKILGYGSHEGNTPLCIPEEIMATSRKWTQYPTSAYLQFLFPDSVYSGIQRITHLLHRATYRPVSSLGKNDYSRISEDGWRCREEQGRARDIALNSIIDFWSIRSYRTWARYLALERL